jgi:hypothetical protein
VSAVATRPAPAELLEPPEGPRGPETLEDHLELVLSDVRREGSAECPVCASEMESAGSGASCGDCGATLR